MRIDCNNESCEPQHHYDVCVVGSGPAGATVANILADCGARICVVESGSGSRTPFSDALRDLDCVGIQIKVESRERVVGGTSTTWAGLSRPLDPIDFQHREWVPYSGWPISRSQLIPFYIDAAERFRFPSWNAFEISYWPELASADGVSRNWNSLEEKLFLATQPLQRFDREFAAVYDRGHVDLYTGCTVTHLGGDRLGARAMTAHIRTADGRAAACAARIFVLAAGGIENPRLLLNSTFACPSGLGNDHGQVGRYFMNHPKGNYGIIRFCRWPERLPGFFDLTVLPVAYSGCIGLHLNEEAQCRHRVLNSYLRFESVADISMSGALTQRGRRFVHYLPNIIDRLGRRLRKVHERTAIKQSAQSTFAVLRNFMEMAPAPENRVLLSNRRDAFGMQLADVRHTPSDLDRRTMVVLHKTLHQELGLLGWAEAYSDLDEEQHPWPISLDASHHMGSTRMGEDPRTSVVNADCRLHFSPNVYLAGGSVFATSGSANPTFTMVALAIRLARHLQTAIREHPAPETLCNDSLLKRNFA